MSDALRIPAYRRRATALHAARASVGSLYCLAPAGVALLVDQPLVLGGLALAVTVAGLASSAAGALATAARFALLLGVLTLVVNALVVRDGLTVIARLGELPPLGQIDVTLEAVVFGGVLALRTAVVLLAVALFVETVDPDQLLAIFRRVSYRSALTASLATRMLPVLAGDARRLDEAQRCRLPSPRPRTRRERWAAHAAIVRAVAVGALDRSVDVAATLEVRGYGSARRRPARSHAPVSRHDIAFSLAAGSLLALSIAARATGNLQFDAYPELHAPLTAADALLAAAAPLLYALPNLDRRGVG